MRPRFVNPRRVAVWSALIVLVLAFALSGCERQPDVATAPDTPKATAVAAGPQQSLSKSDSRIQAAMMVQEKHTTRLMASKDVVGTAVGLNEAGEIVVKIYTVRDGVPNLPKVLDGMLVDVEVTGVIRAMGKPTGPGVSHTAKQTPPIQLGTSGGWKYDVANGYCCGGTLGALVQKDG
ncbi:hypothetical protein EG829_27550, partial [bacterium]|nr:hypothetical protein [bacterium]